MNDQELLYMCLGAIKAVCGSDSEDEELRSIITTLEDRLFSEDETGSKPGGK
jgi:hypothetical protein